MNKPFERMGAEGLSSSKFYLDVSVASGFFCDLALIDQVDNGDDLEEESLEVGAGGTILLPPRFQPTPGPVAGDDKTDLQGENSEVAEKHKIESGDKRAKREYAKSALERPRHIDAEEWERFLSDWTAFETMKEDLIREGYEGKWVAVYDGKRVASDGDRGSLRRRVSKKYRGIPVYIGGCGVREPDLAEFGSLGAGFLP